MTNANYFLNKELERETQRSKQSYCVTASSTQEECAIQYSNRAETFFIPQFSK